MKLLALDIGGANIKAAHGEVSERDPVVSPRAATLTFALWKQPEAIVPMLKEVAAKLPPFEAVSVTMTAELCDCFDGRRSGVHRILDAVAAFAGARPVGVWHTKGHLVTVEQARADWHACASANWHALATWVARLHAAKRSLLIDTGSTTTDITPLVNGSPSVVGMTDFTRSEFGELAYTGVRRTPLMSLSPVTPLWSDGAPRYLMAEHFATTADVYVMLGDLPEEPDNRDTADGRPLTREASRVRLMRMMGTDVQTSMHFHQRGGLARDEDEARWIMESVADGLAEACTRKQESMIADAIGRALTGPLTPGGAARSVTVEQVIVSGSGAFLAARAAAKALPGVPVIRLADTIGAEASTAACAWALLHLWERPGTAVPGL